MSPAETPAALDIRVSGAVQGVGFRPFVHGLATGLGLSGRVRNTAEGVEIEVEGQQADLDTFLARITADVPPLALVADLIWTRARPKGCSGFSIAPSVPTARVDTFVTADAATCPACLEELFDPANRRYRYPFINCVNCGPRFTITKSVPYDRPATTMAGFVMCPECECEYHDPADRRFHAQPNACSTCGPQIRFLRVGHGDHAADGTRVATAALEQETQTGEAALQEAVGLLCDGDTLAVKGLGGYHLACDATSEAAVARLRARKRREEKPFAVMAASLDQIREYCSVSPAEEELLLSGRRPIVLLDRRPPAALTESVAPGTAVYGFLLPYTPLHHLLLAEVGRPIVMTSGNLSEEPLAYEDDDALARLSSLADGFLTHDRSIHMRVDDSVGRAVKGAFYPLRRARGYAPLPVRFSGSRRSILAVGGHLKNTFCITRGALAFLSPHIGDLENLDTLTSLRRTIDHYAGLFAFEPEIVAHDLHPAYLSTTFARGYAAARGLRLVPVQHHEAHIASVLADTGYREQVVGLAFDGAGLGADGTIWGGEFLVGDARGFARAAHLEQIPLLGGDLAATQPWRVALALLDLVRSGASPYPRSELSNEWIAAVIGRLPNGAAMAAHPWRELLQAAKMGLSQPLTSSAGRLFDGVAALLGIRHEMAFEGQAAMMLETEARRAARRQGLTRPGRDAPWPACVPADTRHSSSHHHGRSGDPQPVCIPLAPFVQGVLSDLESGRPRDLIALRFHETFAAACAAVAARLAGFFAVEAVALGGGVFQNMLLLELLVGRLETAGLRVLVHRAVPTNDGGLCLGQAEIAAALADPDASPPDDRIT